MNAIRPIRAEDKEMMRLWRNLPEIAKFMYTDHYISPPEHEKWFERILKDPTCRYWIIVSDSQDVGVVYLYNIDEKSERAHLGLYLATPSVRGKGVGSFAEYNVLFYCFEELQLNKVCCEVLSFNVAGARVHQSFGFKQEGLFRQHVVKAGEKMDVLCLSMLRSEWQALRSQIEERLHTKGIL